MIEYPVLVHLESGRKALLEEYETTEGRFVHPMSYWVRWGEIWVEVDSPLLDYKPDGRRLT